MKSHSFSLLQKGDVEVYKPLCVLALQFYSCVCIALLYFGPLYDELSASPPKHILSHVYLLLYFYIRSSGVLFLSLNQSA